VGGADRRDRLGDGAVLGDVAGASRLDGGDEDGVIREAGEHDDLELGVLLADEPGGVGAQAVREPVVHQGDVGEVAPGHELRLGNRGGGGDHLEVGFLPEDHEQALGEELMVVHDHDLDLWVFAHVPDPMRSLCRPARITLYWYLHLLSG